MKKILILTITCGCSMFTLNSCQTHTQRGVFTGGLAGAAIGAIAAGDGYRGEGALIGGGYRSCRWSGGGQRSGSPKRIPQVLNPQENMKGIQMKNIHGKMLNGSLFFAHSLLTVSAMGQNAVAIESGPTRVVGSDRDKKLEVLPAEADPVTGEYLRAEKIAGKTVRNHLNKDIATIDGLLVDPRSGQIRFVVLSWGGFLGLGERMAAVPWDALEIRYQPTGSTSHSEELEPIFFLDASETMLKNAPQFDTSKGPLISNPAQVEIYWREKQSSK